jgi:Flp pilus assembly protein TadD
MKFSIAVALAHEAAATASHEAHSRQQDPRMSIRLITASTLLALVLSGASGPAAGQVPSIGEIRASVARGDLPGALRQAVAATQAKPDDAQLRFLLGVVHMDLQQDADALAIFTALTQQFPELPDPLNNIALLQARGGRLEEARQSLQSALRADPSHRAARANLGQVYLMLAVQAWELAASAAPGDSALLQRLVAARALLAPTAR